MKMNELIRQWLDFWKKNSKYVFASFYLALGTFIAVRLFQILLPALHDGHTMVPNPNKKDTFYVSVLNGYPVNASKVTSSAGGAGGDSSRYYPFDSARQSPYPQAATRILYSGKADSIHTSEKNERLLITSAGYGKWVVVVAAILIVILLLVLYSGFASLPYIDTNITQDRDPEELSKAFDKLAPQIKELGNPRKIKRFSNKIRFQYNYLKNKSLVKNRVDLENIMRALIEMEYKTKGSKLADTCERLLASNPKLSEAFLQLNKQEIDE